MTGDTDRQDRDQRLTGFIDHLQRVGADLIAERLGAKPEVAQGVMRELAYRIIADHARTTIYVPAKVAAGLNPRNIEIWAGYAEPKGERFQTKPFSMARVADLARLHRLTERAIYGIIAEQREANDAARLAEEAAQQPTLPGLDE